MRKSVLKCAETEDLEEKAIETTEGIESLEQDIATKTCLGKPVNALEKELLRETLKLFKKFDREIKGELDRRGEL